MGRIHDSPSALQGAVTGALLAAPLVAVLSIPYTLFDWRLAPFDLFETVSSALPGPLVTRGIETMVAVIRRLGIEDTARAAKLAEQSLAILAYGGLCAASGALAFLAGRHLPREARRQGPLVVALVPVAIGSAFGQSWHLGALVGAAWTAIAVTAWAAAVAWVQRRLTGEAMRERVGGKRITRREVLVRVGGASAVLTFVGVAVGKLGRGAVKEEPEGMAWSKTHPLPNADASVKPVPGTRPEFTPVSEHYRIDINLTPPRVHEANWRLRIEGLVDRPAAFTLAELRGFEPTHQFITLACISNPVGGDLIGTTRWTGVPVRDVLARVGVRPEATHLKLVSADHFDEIVSLEQVRNDPRVMFTWAWDGMPLTAEHGFPLRIYIPNVYGMKQPKWIERVEAIAAWEPGYWVRRGWDRDATMKATSVIDVIGPDAVRGDDGALRVPVGGIAHAGTRGISKVEVRVDEGPWQAAQLRPPISGQTWVLWRYEWPFEAGRHTFEVRCFDGQGAAQIAESAPPHPSGASGYHRMTWS